MIEVARLWDGAIAGTNRPLVIFNGDLDRLRSQYYPSFFYPKLAKVGEHFVPDVEAAFYVHTFKGAKPATLYRCYPGPWQVLRRHGNGDMKVLLEVQQRPSLREVAMELLPNL
jgi:hypothetical protein